MMHKRNEERNLDIDELLSCVKFLNIIEKAHPVAMVLFSDGVNGDPTCPGCSPQDQLGRGGADTGGGGLLDGTLLTTVRTVPQTEEPGTVRGTRQSHLGAQCHETARRRGAGYEVDALHKRQMI